MTDLRHTIYALVMLLALSLGANAAVSCAVTQALVRTHRGCP